MSRLVVVLTLIGVCCFGTPMVYAVSGGDVAKALYLATKAGKDGLFVETCPQCDGYGRWCENCGGSGKVIRWWAVGLVGVGIVLLFWECAKKLQKRKEV